MIQILLGIAMMIPPLNENADTSYAQKVELEEVVITDFKQNKKNLSPTAVSAANSRLLREQEVVSLKELTALFPNFFMPDYGSRQNSPIFIRGVGAKTKGPAVGFYVDGIPHFENSAFDIDMSDIANVEVYRGPQGTLYGRNAIGGIINVHTHSPFDYQGTRFKVGYGNYNDLVGQVSTYQKFSESFGLSFAADYHHNGGYFENVTTQEKCDDIDSGSGRLGLYWKPADAWLIRLSSMLDYSDQGGYPYGKYDAKTGESSAIDYNRYSSYRRLISTSGLNAQYEGSRFSFNSQTSFQHINDKQGIDQDFTSADNYYVDNGIRQNMLSQEITLKSNNDSRYQWIFGAFGLIQKINNEQATSYLTRDMRQPTHYGIPVYAYALYHQSSYNIWRGLSVSAGVRFDYEYTHIDYSREQTKIDRTNAKHVSDFSSDLHFNQLTPKFSIQYKSTKDQLFYASITRGYKAGGFNQTFQTDEERTYDPEYNWNYEVGTKLITTDRRYSAELSLYYIDWRHQQVNRTVPGVGNVLTNAGHSDSKGLELSLTARPVHALLLSMNYGYTYARFLDYKKSETADYSGNILPLVPRHTLGFHGSYTITPAGFLDKIVVSAGMTGVGKIYWTEDNVGIQRFYALLNAKVSMSKGIFTWDLWGKNLTDTDYVSYYFMSSAGFAQKGRPTTFGTSITVSF